MPEPIRIRTRPELQELEEKTLAPYAAKSIGAHATRRYQEAEHPYRTSFQRDRDRIIHSRAFRRLKHKRQVFLTSESDHYRTRITHTLEVAQLSRTMASVLALNENLVEAIALGHDLGHTPFGHLGEVILNGIMSGKQSLAGHGPVNAGGFKHNYQSVRVVDILEHKYDFPGLNLTAAVREGLLKHTRLKRGQFSYPDFDTKGLHFERDSASTLEGQVVAICDEIAQRTHDLEDGIRAGLVDLDAVRTLDIVQVVEKESGAGFPCLSDSVLYAGFLVRGLINFLMNDVIRFTAENIGEFISTTGRTCDFDWELVRFSPEADPLQKQLNAFIYKKIIHFSRMHWSDELGEKLLSRLFDAYFHDPDLLPEALAPGPKAAREQSPAFMRAICDYIAGMTDHYAIREAEHLAQLKKLNVDDLCIDSALGHTFQPQAPDRS